jgi:hypothetical protein
MRALLRLASLVCVILGSNAAAEPATSYSFVEIATQKLARIDYYATFDPSCAPALAPAINVVQQPKFGALIIRRGGLVTKRVSGCSVLKTPVLVVFYRSRVGYIGPDHLVYSITSRNGSEIKFDVTISVKGGGTYSVVTAPPV